MFLTDVYAGPGLQGVPRGTVKSIRVIEYYFSRRGFGGLYGTLGLDGPWDVKRILGTVPVEADGSAFFNIPANSPLALQPLDEQGQGAAAHAELVRGHAGRGRLVFRLPRIPERRRSRTARPSPRVARRRRWNRGSGLARGFSFVREVQPVLDKYCVACHDGTEPGRPYFKGDRPLTDWTSQLAGRWDGGGGSPRPTTNCSGTCAVPASKATGGCSRRSITTSVWTTLGTCSGRATRVSGSTAKPGSGWSPGWISTRPSTAPGARSRSSRGDSADAQRLARVNQRAAELRRLHVPMGPHPDYDAIPETPAFDTTPVRMAGSSKPKAQSSTPVCAGAGRSMPRRRRRKQQAAAADGQVARTLELGDGVTLELIRIPGGRFVMGSNEGAANEAPPGVVDVPSFWMARCETANRQFRQFNPAHESRTEDRNGYQFGVVGYDQDQPEQPAVRVSWQEAMDFCRWLSERSGLVVTLPTEAQWEWACRAGAATPFWFGDCDAQLLALRQPGDQRLAEFAADTSRDNDTAARPMVNPNRYDDWIPRDDRFNDGGFVTEPVGGYRANPWGLHDVHGNAWESALVRRTRRIPIVMTSGTIPPRPASG